MESLAKSEVSQYEFSNVEISNKAFFSFLFQSFIYGTVVGAMSLLIPLFALKLSADTIQVGLITGSRGMSHFLLVIPVGLLVNRFGIKKVFITSSFLSFLIVLSITNANNPSILLLFAFIEGLTCSTRLTALNSWCFKILPFLKSSQMGWYKGSSSIGLTILGPILASFLSDKLGFTLTFILIAIIILIANLIEIFSETKIEIAINTHKKSEKITSSIMNLVKMLKKPKLLFVAYGESASSGLTSCFRILMVLLLVGFMHKESSSVSLVTALLGIAYLFVVFLGGHLLNYLKSTYIFICSSCIIIIAFIIMATNYNIIFISFASFLVGMGLGFLNLVNYKIISVIPGNSANISTIITFSTGVSLFISPMIISFILGLFSFKAGFFTLILPFIIIIVLVGFKARLINES
ncbi:arabinose efflux permease [Clostridium pasteurianum DSM 525 = ATCC 6013]|uniref:Arabinose efflux permease n=1 Tax=Clostridium pasteurianum DSM 525 = ATCC 6013 TaxID=1262449 RepID=A0A0H3J9X7_CLOPA|nr:MFS transporter [Clostridium pasteurianum]AJA49063.1 arabinose efflux permease [Clostridium pasteurianum DSM 525 = ATCC 6013]AJA53051.1 arabinose efflux permease [Clostridium pasteurianum DSM 525 = ATCC 6013]AOZ76265.1 hypothetical protein AQ983_14575 [Clostridium pasteurianum DSM 525 = ATCC 6013]AOZ80061.1 hypothetical protein AQ984_14570 [Clostridium pasteurianum]ELP59000.1 major facilitator superfamily protein [Clostridium pasteurianum DSM 525 = ATCC 6013]